MNYLGIYEKAMPVSLSIPEKLKYAKQLGFNFIEMSIDESDQRLARLTWSKDNIHKINETQLYEDIYVQSICLSGHRRYPLGSSDENIRNKALEIMFQAIDLAQKIGVRVIQLAGYDVYYETKSQLTAQNFKESLNVALDYAAKKQVILALEIMDDTFLNSISKYIELKEAVSNHPYLKVYPDVGNLSAWPQNNVPNELAKGINDTVAIHLKDTLPVTADFKGKFKDVPFGEGEVDFVEVFQTLQRLKYNGPFLIEMWSENLTDPKEVILNAKTFIEKAIVKSGVHHG
ncbi:L-ribulose-5-phosphate 3-epimerase [Staphylococcus kloosii]|uniref:L-ribulose-5-phosphate 3-epimerase n=1 Tax=Staphylococcus kloosii TaxID=29384 RepID=A0ABQ0XKN0_9STAP|nr:L-ribulose-5-phosphate 3-epimerase [Staphylococcus kloosii]AVQ34714.1 L-ribulose-5-phosphate 3-epimerase [Staphylococcus kloosii]PNZ07629.1 xylulose 5-phosphate 3-epimerase [Staphylococcus kloosii]PTJ79022.1 L-ribulose-5-phosphate 3-epimerase [Staphylococcus kloosii]SUM50269.1 hexulose-6-phosphate isomerase [Staphylococcus kloosii]GEP82007.1 L-xylulose 5-phosphate 3-epimerase [Staphylococcus kloosii]